MNISKEELKNLVEKIERLNDDKAAINEDLRDVYLDANSKGFDIKTLKQIIKLRKVDKKALEQQEALLDLYRRVIGI